MVTYNADGTVMVVDMGAMKIKSDHTKRYSFSEDKLIIEFGMGIKWNMSYDLSMPGVLKLNNFGGVEGTKANFFNFADVPVGNDIVISGQWLRDDNEGSSSLWDFKTNKDLHILTYFGGAKTVDRTYEYRVSGNNLIIHSLGDVLFDISAPGIFTIEEKLGEQMIKLNFYNFNVSVDEFVTLERASDIETALANAARVIINSVQQGNNIAITNFSSDDRSQSDFVTNELEFVLLKANLSLVDRSQLDVIRREQNLQLSGDVADDQIVSIGRFAGARLIITGSITGSDSTRRLRLRLLDTETGHIITAASERF